MRDECRVHAPPLRRILETALYCDDIAAAAKFYVEVIGLEVIVPPDRRQVFFRCGEGVLLIFDPRVTSVDPTSVNGGLIPLHGASGHGHAAFAARDDELPAWRERLERAGVPIESEVNWPRGGHSIYFRDPAGNSLEIASPRIWGIPE